MKKLFLSLIFAFSQLVATDLMIYKGHQIIGNSFKIQFENGLIFDACNCGCPKDAADAIATWNIGDEIDVSAYVADQKGQIYLLTNLENDVQLFSWFKDPSSRLFEIISIDHEFNIIKTADNRYWTLLNECSWAIGDRIAILSSINLPLDERFLINLDSKEQPYKIAVNLLALGW